MRVPFFGVRPGCVPNRYEVVKDLRANPGGPGAHRTYLMNRTCRVRAKCPSSGNAVTEPAESRLAGCAEYAQKLEGESPLLNLMEVKS